MNRTIMISLFGAVIFFATPALATGLLDSVPDPVGSKSADWKGIQDGGQHTYFRASEPAQDAARQYRSALESRGWSIVDFYADGSSYGSSGRVVAKDGDRYLLLLSNGPGKTAHINLCVWPSKPGDDDC